MFQISRIIRTTCTLSLTRRRISSEVPKPVITIPVKVQERAVRRHQKLKNIVREADREKLKNKPLIISAKRPEFNHRQTQTYGKFDTVPLASAGWHHRKSYGDYFQINPFTSNDAVSWYKKENASSRLAPRFSDYSLDPRLVSSLESAGFVTPTNIQHEAIPRMLEHGDSHALIAAETGNGKTLCLLLPILHSVLGKVHLDSGQKNSPKAVVVTPGKELADQIGEVATKLAGPLGVRVVVQKGGNVRSRIQNPRMEHQVDILIGTLGSLDRMFKGRLYKMDNVTQIALDEIDTLLDDTFKDELLNFLNLFGRESLKMGCGVTVSMAGATFPTNFNNYLADVVDVEDMLRVSTRNLHKVLPHVPQKFILVAPSRKDQELLQILQKVDLSKQKILIFCNTTASSNFVNHFLNDNNVTCVNFNKSVDSKTRNENFEKFMCGEAKVISATDLASRGLDTGTVNHVINFDYPLNMADYLHRAGRVGRVGSVVGGRVTNLVDGYIGVEMVQNLELAVRKNTELPNVNANIARIIQHREVRRKKGTLPPKKVKIKPKEN